MAGNYKKKNTMRRSSNGLTSQLLLIGVSMTIGYVVASFFDYNCLMAWVNTTILRQTPAKVALATATQPNELPKPKFEFYTLLAKGQVQRDVQQSIKPAPSPVTVAENTMPIVKNTMPIVVDAPPSKALPLHAPLAPTNTPAQAVAIPSTDKGSYLVQVASFRSMREAERMKATLVMKGFDVGITMASAQQINWYRVIIGPFSSKVQAQQAQQAFAKREHIVGMIRRMDA